MSDTQISTPSVYQLRSDAIDMRELSYILEDKAPRLSSVCRRLMDRLNFEADRLELEEKSIADLQVAVENATAELYDHPDYEHIVALREAIEARAVVRARMIL